MIEQTERNTLLLNEENPWPGFREFDEDGERFFNGRDKETMELFRLVRNEPLTLLYGKSGLGKTSLLQAGLFRHLRDNQLLPVYMRIDPRNRETPLVRQVEQAFREELSRQEIEHPPFNDNETLWEYLHRDGLELWSRENQLITPVFIFDQFEELFTLGAENPKAVNGFRVDIADLIENRIPDSLADRFERSDPSVTQLDTQKRTCKVLLSFREEYLPDVRGYISYSGRNWLHLKPMNCEQAFKAVFETGGKLVNEDTAYCIVKSVSEREIHETYDEPGYSAGLADGAIIEPALLSMFCTSLNERRKTLNRPDIDKELVDTAAEKIVEDFYNECVRDLPERTRRFIEDNLVTDRGFRNSYPKDDAVSNNLISESDLQRLINKRLLRVEPYLGTERIELIHDRLTGVVKAFHDRESERQKKMRELAVKQEKRRRVLFRGVSLSALLAILLAGVFVRLWMSVKEANRKAVSAKMAMESRAILDGSQEGTDQLGLQLALAAYRLQHEPNEVDTNISLQFWVENTSAVIRIAEIKENFSCAAVSGDGGLVALGGEEGKIYLWDTAGNKIVGEFENVLAITSLAISSDGKHIISGGDDGSVWQGDVSNRKSLKPLKPLEELSGYLVPVTSLAFSRDGKNVVCGWDDGRILLWDIPGRKPISKLSGHEGSVTSLAFSPDGGYFVAGGVDGTVQLRDISGRKISKLSGRGGSVTSLAFSDDGRSIVSVSDGTVRWWDYSEKQSLKLDENSLLSMAFSMDGGFIATGGYDGKVRLWDFKNKTRLCESPPESDGWISGVAISPDRKLLIYGWNNYSNEGMIRVLDIKEGKQTGEYSRHQGILSGVAISPDGGYVASGWNNRLEDGTYIVRLWDINNKKVCAELETPKENITCIAVSQERKYIATGGCDGSVRIWDVSTKKQIGELSGHKGPVRSLAFSNDSKYFVSGGYDGTVRLWDFNTRKSLGMPLEGHEGAVLSVAFTPDEKIVSGGEDKTIRYWDAPAAWADLLCSKLTRNLSKTEWEQYVGDIRYVKQCPDLPVPVK